MLPFGQWWAHDQHVAGEIRITVPQAMVSLMSPHLVAFSAEHEHICVILIPDDGLLDLERSTDIAFWATSQPLENVVGRNLTNIAWCRYASKNINQHPAPLDFIERDSVHTGFHTG